MNEPSSQNPYSAPASSLQESPQQDPTSFNIDYDFNIGEVFSEAWKRVNGTKGTFFGAFCIYFIIIMAMSFLAGLLSGLNDISNEELVASTKLVLLFNIVILIVCYPLITGIMMMGIRRAADQPISVSEIFNYFGATVPILLTGILMLLLIYLGMFLLLLPGIYLSVAYIFAFPLVAERGLSPWQALETSRKAVTRHWFKIFGFLIVLNIIMFISMIPLGIGLIWTAPLAIIAIGVLYRIIFGVRPQNG